MSSTPDHLVTHTLGRDLSWEREPTLIRTIRWYFREGFYWESETLDHLTTDLPAVLAWLRARQEADADHDRVVWQVQLIVDELDQRRGAVNVLGYDPVERDRSGGSE